MQAISNQPAEYCRHRKNVKVYGHAETSRDQEAGDTGTDDSSDPSQSDCPADTCTADFDWINLGSNGIQSSEAPLEQKADHEH